MNEKRAREKFVNSRIQLLRDFNIIVTDDIIEHIKSLYPSEVLAENYTRKIILKNLGE